MKVSITNKSIIKLAAPISLAMFIPLLNNLTNNYFLGQVGELELAVNGVSGITYLVLTMVGFGLANGVQIQFSRRAAQNDRQGITSIFVNSIMLSLFLSLCLMMLTLWMAPVIFGFSLSTSHIYPAITFLFIRVWGLPFLMMTQLANSFFISIGRSKYLMAGSAVATIVNIVLDYALILGHWGFPALGLKGAAIGSVVAEIAAFAIMYGLFYLQGFYTRYPLLQYFSVDLELCKKILLIATPLIIQFFFSIAGWQVFFIFVEHLGEREAAASQVLRSLFTILGTVTWAFGATCSAMVSNIISQERSAEVPYLVRKIARISFLCTAVMCSLLLYFGRNYLGLFSNDQELINLALPSLRVIVVAALIMSQSTVVFNAVMGSGRTMVNLFIEITCVSSYLIYCYVIIQKMRLPLYMAWGSEFIYWSTLLICGGLYLRSGKWKGKTI